MSGMSQIALIEATVDTVVRGGWVMWPIFISGWIAWLLILERGYQVLKLHGRSKSSLLATLSSEVRRLHSLGHDSVMKGVELHATEAHANLRKHMRTIQMFAAMAPLMGLLGTVSGMVHTFEIITLFGFGNPVLLAEGISEALLTTQAGLLVAFPIVLAYNFIHHRMEYLEDRARAEALRLAGWLDSHPEGGST